MSLRAKTIFYMSAALVGLVVVLQVTTFRLLMTSYVNVERMEGQRENRRAQDALQGEIRKIDLLCEDWSAWDDSYAYIRDHNKRYEAANLSDETLKSSRNDVVIYADEKGRIVYAVEIDQVHNKRLPVERHLLDQLKPGGALWRGPDTRSPRKGAIKLPDGLMLISCWPILTSKGTGPARGMILLGRRLNDSVLAEVRILTDNETTIEALGRRLSPSLEMARRRLEAAGGVYFAPYSINRAAAYSWLNDITGKRVGIVRVGINRAVSVQARRTVGVVIASLLCVALVFGLVVLTVLERAVIRPVMRIHEDIVKIRPEVETVGRVRIPGKDELSRMAVAINRMLDAVDSARTEQRRSERLYHEMSAMALTAGDALFIFEPESGSITWHGSVAAMLGCDATEIPLTVKEYLLHVHPDDAEQATGAYYQATQGIPAAIEHRIMWRDGSIRHWAVSARLSLEAGDGARKIVGACTDITKRKHREETLRNSEERLSRIVETNAEAILIVGSDGTITLANAASETILGLTRSEILRRRITDESWGFQTTGGEPILPDDLPHAIMQRKNGSVQGLQLSALHASGRRIILSVNAAPLREAATQTTGAVIVAEDITERKMLEERLTYQAFHDSLTGLPNRALFMERLTRAATRASRTHKPMAVLFVDLDNFKLINDSLGHGMGDHLLVSVARRLEKCLRDVDTAARFGGDEFTILAEEATGTDAMVALAQRIVDCLAKPFLLGTHEIYITPSIGIAVSGLTEIRPDELLREADSAMFEAKSRGKARIEVYTPALNLHAMSRLVIENDLRHALENNELEVYYQPKVHIGTGKIEGMEALSRWNHPHRGYVSPVNFIPIAEQSDLIVLLGRWILKEACKQLREWQDKGIADTGFAMAVNVSGRQFQNERLTEEVALVLRETGIDPGCLTLEITESVIMSDADSTIEKLTALKAIGVRLAIDDFGTGYSSLSYLKRFPMDFIKIDKSFVDGLGKDAEDTVIVSATTSLAHALGLTVVAEGAETQSQVDHLRRLGCDIVQGYWYSRPVDAKAAEEYLTAHRQHDAELAAV